MCATPRAARRTTRVAVAAVNDAPTLAAPEALAAVEDEPAAVAGVAVGDVDAAESFSGLVEVTAAVGNGTLALGSTVGLQMLEDGAAGAPLRFRGALGAVNEALAGLTYTGAPDWSGDDALAIEVSDLGAHGRGRAARGVGRRRRARRAGQRRADDRAAARRALAATEDEPLALAARGLAIGDADADGARPLTVSLAAANGAPALAAPEHELGVRVTTADGGALAFVATLDAANAALAATVYAPAPHWNSARARPRRHHARGDGRRRAGRRSAPRPRGSRSTSPR